MAWTLDEVTAASGVGNNLHQAVGIVQNRMLRRPLSIEPLADVVSPQLITKIERWHPAQLRA